jgi:lysozyme family protein
MGVMTLAAVRDAERAGKLIGLIVLINQRRMTFVRGLSTFDTFGKGWTRRIMGNKTGAQPSTDVGVIDRSVKLASGALPSGIPAPAEKAVGRAEAEGEDATPQGGSSGVLAAVKRLLVYIARAMRK